MANRWDRVISFVDRFGKRRDILLMDPERHERCLRCYGTAWPAMRMHMARVHMACLALRQLGG